MMTKREEAARALAEEYLGKDPPWEHLPRGIRDAYLKRIDVVIDSLMEPSPEMVHFIKEGRDPHRVVEAAVPERPQINAWKAIEFAMEEIDDLGDRIAFLQDCMENDMLTIGEPSSPRHDAGWPEFVTWIKEQG
jgi:hypothetical protein